MCTGAMSDAEHLWTQLEQITVWARRGQRAPHKPLLLLMALASVQRREPRLRPFAQIEAQLKRLLIDFGPPRRSYHPEYPFWRLQNDGDFWDIPERDALRQRIAGRRRQGDVPRTLLRELGAQGGFSQEAHATLTDHPEGVHQITARLLAAHFPASLHEDILNAVGMPWVVVTRPQRDPHFREAILRIYEHRCAVCGFDGRLGSSHLGLEAAHVRWHSAGGPDHEDNGLALCVFHHKALDRGALGIDPDRRVLISQEVHGSTGVDELLLRFVGQPLRVPQPGTAPVAGAHIAWHNREVFRKPARHAG
ncbi:MAG: phosphorothioated DNA-binding restriction endonuclease [Myxococcota bacterium]